MKVFVSSLAFSRMDVFSVGEVAEENGLAVEFTANFPPDTRLGESFKSLPISKLAHNYFPPPEKAFVLNLASSDKGIRTRSLMHCEAGINLAAEAGTGVFSAHAGFCIDPNPEQLGNRLDQPAKIDRQHHWDIFLNSCKYLAAVAERKNVSFFIENNVLSAFNKRSDDLVPLLCTEPNEILLMLREVPSENFGFLLDTAHLKVSANTLGFSLLEAAKKLTPYAGYIHHSDNNGFIDSNEPITDRYWFLPLLKETINSIHVLEVKNQNLFEIQKQITLLRSNAYE